MQTPPSPGRGVLASMAEAHMSMVESIVRGTYDYWSDFIGRGGNPADVPIDVLSWWGLMLRREEPQWSTDSEIVRTWPLARLRDFSGRASDRDSDVVPTLILPPHAGHDSCIVDFSTDQSQVRTARAAGLDRLWVLDWAGASSANRHASIAEHVATIAEAVETVGGRVNLIGDSQGGWLAAIYAALHPESVASLVVAGGAIDHEAGDQGLRRWLTAAAPDGNLGFFRNLVALNGGVIPGELLTGSLLGAEPKTELTRAVDLLGHIRDEAHVERFRRFEAWFRWTQPVAGDFYLWMVEHLYLKNELATGTLEVDGRTVDLRAIECPVHLVAGEHDATTRPEQVFAMADLVGTPGPQVRRHLAPGGQFGLFMGHDALRAPWPTIFASIAARSGAAAQAPAPDSAPDLAPDLAPGPAPDPTPDADSAAGAATDAETLATDESAAASAAAEGGSTIGPDADLVGTGPLADPAAVAEAHEAVAEQAAVAVEVPAATVAQTAPLTDEPAAVEPGVVEPGADERASVPTADRGDVGAGADRRSAPAPDEPSTEQHVAGGAAGPVPAKRAPAKKAPRKATRKATTKKAAAKKTAPASGPNADATAAPEPTADPAPVPPEPEGRPIDAQPAHSPTPAHDVPAETAGDTPGDPAATATTGDAAADDMPRAEPAQEAPAAPAVDSANPAVAEELAQD